MGSYKVFSALQADFTANLARRYRRLFRLPTLRITSVLAALIYALALAELSLVKNLALLPTVGIFLASIALLFAVLLLEQLILRRSKLAKFRRLAFLSAASSGILLFASTIGTLLWLSTGSGSGFVSFVVLGVFLALSFRIVVIRAVFSRDLAESLFVAALEPALLLFPVVWVVAPISLQSYSVAIGGGVLALASTLVYISAVASFRKGYQAGPLELLKDFLLAWSEADGSALDEELERSSANSSVETRSIEFETPHGKAAIVVPEVHPGPFYPIGSHNLPFDIARYLHERGTVPIVLHGISKHATNLPSKKEVQAYLESLNSAEVIERGDQCSDLVHVESGRAKISALAFGSVAFSTITLWPYGMEDFPEDVGRTVSSSAKTLGWRDSVIVDAHNSEDGTPTPEDCESVKMAAHDALKRLESAAPTTLQVGFAHSWELNQEFGPDVGPGGVAAITFLIEGRKWVLVAFDANNALRELRERLAASLERDGISVLEVCTSDTHFTAARAPGAKGYLALGEKTEFRQLEENVRTLVAKSSERLEKAKFTVKLAMSRVKVMSEGLIESFSRLLDALMPMVKKGGIALILLALASIAANLLYNL